MRRATQREYPSAGEVAGWLVNEELKRNRIISRDSTVHSGHDRSNECPVKSEYRGNHRILAATAWIGQKYFQVLRIMQGRVSTIISSRGEWY